MGHLGRVVSVNVGSPRLIEWQGRRAPTAIWKSPVEGRVAVRGVNLTGDDQGDRSVHGGPDKAVYAYAREDMIWWGAQLGRPIQPGEFGENLTLMGVAVSDALIGERWAVGSTLLEIAQPRFPCWKLGARMNDPDFPQRFADAGRLGAYLRIIDGGDVGAGDDVFLVHRPSHGITVGTVGDVYLRDRERAGLLLNAPELPERWRAWAREHKQRGEPGTRG